MTIYEIQGTQITIPSDIENYRYIEDKFIPFFKSVPDQFGEWYSKQYDCKSVYKNISEIKQSILAPMLDKCISTLTNNDIYSIDSALFKRKYLTDHFDDLDDTIAEMMHKIAEIEGDQQAAAQYRRMRKDSRGRWIGGGFGMSGAVKGAMGAGMMNAATGIGHSAINAIGNIGTSIAASGEKSKVYSNYKSELTDCTKSTVFCVQVALMKAMSDEGEFKFRTISDDDVARAKAMMNNLDAIPDDKKLSHLLQVLKIDPYNTSVYKYIWCEYGDLNGELKRMSLDFHTGLKEYIDGYCEDFAEYNDKHYCYSYNLSDNPQKAALKYENDIKQALEKLKEFCDLHTIAYTDIKYYKKYCDILSRTDNLKRTVEDVVYDTFEEAESVRQDIRLFYECFKKCDITDLKATLELVKNHRYRSKAFVNSLDLRIEREIKLRTPELLFENLKNIIDSKKYHTDIQKEFEIERIHSGIRVKRPAMEAYTGLDDDETPLILLERVCGLLGGKGNGKSGFLITNKNIKIYSGAVTSKEKENFDIKTIKHIECLGADKYELQLANIFATQKKSYTFTLGMNYLSIDDQNKMAELLMKLVFTVQNIDNKKLAQIHRIYKDSKICICGTYLLSNELSCPTCHRFLQSDGSFVESVVCPVCNKHLKPLSKFCTGCGHMFDELEESTVLIDVRKSNESIWIECNNCHQKILSKKKFCQYCGNPVNILHLNNSAGLEDNLHERTCPKCGNMIKSGKNFCNQCGTKIKN